jgi:hypothetical protein
MLVVGVMMPVRVSVSLVVMVLRGRGRSKCVMHGEVVVIVGGLLASSRGGRISDLCQRRDSLPLWGHWGDGCDLPLANIVSSVEQASKIRARCREETKRDGRGGAIKRRADTKKKSEAKKNGSGGVFVLSDPRDGDDAARRAKRVRIHLRVMIKGIGRDGAERRLQRRVLSGRKVEPHRRPTERKGSLSGIKGPPKE